MNSLIILVIIILVFGIGFIVASTIFVFTKIDEVNAFDRCKVFPSYIQRGPEGALLENTRTGETEFYYNVSSCDRTPRGILDYPWNCRIVLVDPGIDVEVMCSGKIVYGDGK